MKKLVPLLFFIFSVAVSAQEWQPTYIEAVACATENDKPLILVFSGSDWCAPCIQLDKTVWQSEAFKSYAKNNCVLFRADFPRKKANKLSKEQIVQNGKLAERFNPRGHFPLVVILSKEEQVLGTTGYKKATPKEYIAHLNTFLK